MRRILISKKLASTLSDKNAGNTTIPFSASKSNSQSNRFDQSTRELEHK
jgi:hypothetical protein